MLNRWALQVCGAARLQRCQETVHAGGLARGGGQPAGGVDVLQHAQAAGLPERGGAAGFDEAATAEH